MPLFDPNRAPALDPADAVLVVHAFLERCRRWAVEREIPDRLRKVQESHDPADAAKLHEWVAWERFVEHAMAELRDGTLDPWFTGSDPLAGPPSGAPHPDEPGPARYSPGRERETTR